MKTNKSESVVIKYNHTIIYKLSTQRKRGKEKTHDKQINLQQNVRRRKCHREKSKIRKFQKDGKKNYEKNAKER